MGRLGDDGEILQAQGASLPLQAEQEIAPPAGLGGKKRPEGTSPRE
jgi:hypothetical protein